MISCFFIFFHEVIMEGCDFMKNVIFSSENLNFVKASMGYINDYLTMINDPSIQDFIFVEPIIFSYDDEVEWVKSHVESDVPTYTIVDKDGKFIGTIDFKNIKSDSAEMGVCITSDFQDKHYGTEAIKRFIDYGFDEFDFGVIYLRVFSHNSRAIHCYKKIGFVEYDVVKNVKKSNGKDVDEIYMKIKKK